MKIAFVVHSLFTIGGTIRTTLNTATALADLGHQVEIASVFRHRTTALFDLDPRLSVVCLVDARRESKAEPLGDADAALAAKPSRVFPATEPRYDQYHRLADERVEKYLSGCDADVIVGTRPGLNVYLAAYAPKSAVTVGQEHLFLDHHGRRLTSRLYKTYRKLDALTTVSAADARHYAEKMPRIADKVSHIPNSVQATTLEPSDCSSHTIVAAGRLEKVKRYDLLLHAFAAVVRRHPDWRLRIYGHGKESAALRQLSQDLGLSNSVRLMGTRTPIDAEWVKGSIAAVTSDLESFGLTIVEAMDCGLPVVATACPYGPPEIITDGVNGLLTTPGDADEYAAALCRLIEDAALRRSMSAAAQKTATRYSPAEVGGQYSELFERLLAAKGRQAAPPSPTPSRPSTTPAAVSCRAVSFAELSILLPAAPVQQDAELVSGRRRVPVPAPASQEVAIKLTASLLDTLAPGSWTLHLNGSPAPVDRIDARTLLAPPPAAPTTTVVPFKQDGSLALRVWRQTMYAELDTLQWSNGSIHLRGTLLGDPPRDCDAMAALRLRKAPDREVSATLELSDHDFTISIAADDLLAEESTGTQLWDLQFTIGETTVPVTKVFDDIAQRKKSHRFPAREYGDGARRRVHPYFTIDNELSVKVSDVEDE